MASDREAGRGQPSSAGDLATETPLGESRWPPVAAVLVFMAINIAVRVWLPSEGAVHVPWLLPTIEGALLVVLLTSDPSGLAERQRMRRVSLVLVGLLVCAALWATVLLVSDLIRGKGVTNSPDQLLASGAIVWLGNNLAFGLLYWLIDGGGPIARFSQAAASCRLRVHPAPQPRGGSPRLEARLLGLHAPRVHERDRVQPR